MKKSEAAELVMMLMGAFPNARTNESTSQVYEAMLLDLDVAVARQAATRLIATSKFLPSIAEIREATTAQTHGPRKTGAEAFGELNEARRRFGPYRECRFNPETGRLHWRTPWPPLAPDVERAMMLTWGSWVECCTVPGDHDMADRARFIAAYDGLSERQRQDLVAGQALPAPTSPAARLEPRNNRAAQALVVTNGAAGNSSAQADKTKASATAPAAPAVPIASPRPKPGPTPFQRRMTADELEAELAKTGGAP